MQLPESDHDTMWHILLSLPAWVLIVLASVILFVVAVKIHGD